MATYVKCDRCKDEIKAKAYAAADINRQAAITGTKIQYDLCPKCDIEFVNFMNPPKAKQ